MPRNAITLLCLPLLALLCAVPRRTLAHNWLSEPHPYDRRTKSAEGCRGRACHDFCPELRRNSRISARRPAATWRRGQRVSVSWTRNNHHGGLFRLSLVPASRLYDARAHARLTLLHGCWDSGATRCKSPITCGTDKGRVMMRRAVVVPDVFPDGVYALGYVWYGGLHFRRRRGHFPDFVSCTFVRVRGGRPVARAGMRYRPFFEAGAGRGIVRGLCPTSADAVGQCVRRGCTSKKAFLAKPKSIRTGSARAYSASDVRGMFRGGDGDAGADGGDKTDNSSLGICRFGTCCPRRCGQCGGSGCAGRPGGANACCSGVIKRSKRVCGKQAPPCKQE